MDDSAMATRTTVQLEDDLSGGTADETVRFALDGKVFEIDLTAKNADKLRKAFAPYVIAGRRLSLRRSTLGSRVPGQRTGAADDSASIRQWARENGYEVSSRGRISAELRQAYLSA